MANYLDMSADELVAALRWNAEDIGHITQGEAVPLLKAAQCFSDDPEMAHIYADAILLATASPEVKDAYNELCQSCSWWACA